MYTKYILETFDKLVMNRNRPDNICEGVTFEHDIRYGEEKLETMDLFYPSVRTDKPLPIILSIHGGGLYGGDKNTIRAVPSFLASKGYFAVSINYPLPPKNKFPAPIKSVFKVIEFLKENKEKFNLNLNKIVLTGDSAGAYQASLISCIIKDENISKSLDLVPPCKGEDIVALMLFCGFYEVKTFLKSKPKFVVRDMVKSYFGKVLKEEDILSLHASPLRFVTKDFPPSFVAYASRDVLKNESINLINTLNENGVFNRSYEGKKEGHDFHLDFRKSETINCLNEAVHFLNHVFLEG
ncbi:MAG: alpha/beta hydrolase [Firmicutes bacterium]|nr:alpha/beta hydrolase [Bacillota bacterium]